MKKENKATIQVRDGVSIDFLTQTVKTKFIKIKEGQSPLDGEIAELPEGVTIPAGKKITIKENGI